MPWLMCSFTVHAGRLPSAILAWSDPVPLCVCPVRGPAILQLPEVQGGALIGALAKGLLLALAASSACIASSTAHIQARMVQDPWSHGHSKSEECSRLHA